MYRYDVNEFLATAMREDPVSQYSAWALREFLMNAIIHRDYFWGNAPIKFYEYRKNRIEISSPGELFGRAKPDNFPFVNDYRNPLLAEAMKILGMVNKYNRGIAKANKELEKNGNPRAQFDINKLTEFRVTIVSNEKSGTMKDKSGTMNFGKAKLYDIESQDAAVFAVVAERPGIKNDQIFLRVQTSIRSVQRTLDRLVKANKIEYRGSKQKGGWFVKT